MSNYRYTLSDYNAIKEADIAINGITVLAGENGCGKSTLLKSIANLLEYRRSVMIDDEEVLTGLMSLLITTC